MEQRSVSEPRIRLRAFRGFRHPQILFGLLLAASSILAMAQSEGRDRWVGTWATGLYSQANPKGAFAENTTLRQIVHVSVGGIAVRVLLSNEFGTSDLKIGGATVAIPAPPTINGPDVFFYLRSNIHPSSAIQQGTAKLLQFGGSPSVTIPAGSFAISDPVPMRVQPLSDLAVTMFIPGQKIDSITFHDYSGQTSFEVSGNQLNAEDLNSPSASLHYRFLKAVDVSGKAKGTIVCYGDSITDGTLAKFNANHRWCDILATRLQGNRATSKLGVMNEGIGGNAVLHDLTFNGPNALSRFDRDVIAQAGVKYVILLEGINDIWRVQKQRQTSDVITADNVISAYKQMIVRAHMHGIKVIGATLTPYQGAHTDCPAGQAIRDKVNDFILSGGYFDGSVDFAKATADPANPKHYLKLADGGDHLHPSDAGYKMMGDSIDLKLFTK
ncbi:MAG TPA: SGNH/GDSL hydrolase family protein [Terracidiphilus sp.]|nr:SGNH/GDSL hydrolase family protein [Terracidiphilus sp.]